MNYLIVMFSYVTFVLFFVFLCFPLFYSYLCYVLFFEMKRLPPHVLIFNCLYCLFVCFCGTNSTDMFLFDVYDWVLRNSDVI